MVFKKFSPRPPRPPRSKRRIVFACALIALVSASIYVLSTGSKSGNNVTQAPTNPLEGKSLYVNPNSNAARQAALWRDSRAEDARQMDRLAAMPSSRWVGEQATAQEVRSYVQAAQRAKKLPTLVAYNILNRDCGKYSAGGADTIEAYKTYITMMAKAIDKMPAVVILEPDALAQMDAKRDNGQPCLSEAEKDAYFQLTEHSIDILKAKPEIIVYVDAGNSGWMPDAPAMAAKLSRAGVAKADGFSLNVSNFRTNDETIAYGTDIAHRIGDKHFVVDTSRNGLGAYDNPIDPAYNWCNPPGRALGHYPTTDTGKELVDAYLYIKNIGESDGTDPDPQHCFNGPKAGEWSPEYALGLVQRWPTELQPR